MLRRSRFTFESTDLSHHLLLDLAFRACARLGAFLLPSGRETRGGCRLGSHLAKGCASLGPRCHGVLGLSALWVRFGASPPGSPTLRSRDGRRCTQGIRDGPASYREDHPRVKSICWRRSHGSGCPASRRNVPKSVTRTNFFRGAVAFRCTPLSSCLLPSSYYTCFYPLLPHTRFTLPFSDL